MVGIPGRVYYLPTMVGMVGWVYLSPKLPLDFILCYSRIFPDSPCFIVIPVIPGLIGESFGVLSLILGYSWLFRVIPASSTLLNPGKSPMVGDTSCQNGQKGVKQMRTEVRTEVKTREKPPLNPRKSPMVRDASLSSGVTFGNGQW